MMWNLWRHTDSGGSLKFFKKVDMLSKIFFLIYFLNSILSMPLFSFPVKHIPQGVVSKFKLPKNALKAAGLAAQQAGKVGVAVKKELKNAIIEKMKGIPQDVVEFKMNKALKDTAAKMRGEMTDEARFFSSFRKTISKKMSSLSKSFARKMRFTKPDEPFPEVAANH